jgi:hypothetical protein
LAGLSTTTGIDVDATLLAPVAVAAETGLPLATTSERSLNSPDRTSPPSFSSERGAYTPSASNRRRSGR